ncbi:MAG: hypothetical protein Q4G03_09405 [Planctomycetia bacterium]|nr:hypothetical protein [Planctomycetia bacterium]
MKIRITACLIAMVAVIASAKAFAQDCAPCAAAAGDVTCASCAPCASCTGASCELFGGLRSLLACRPCVSPCTIVPTCTTCAPAPAPVSVSCAPVAPTCGPIVASSIPSCGCDAAPSCGCDAIPAPTPCCAGPMFPYLKPCLYNAVHRPINGVCKLVHGAFSALADATTPVEDCGFFQPAYVADVTCGSCATCGAVEVAPAPCGPAAPSCN